MDLAKSVEEYIELNPWKEELAELRAILQSTDLREELKWGTPHYLMDNKIVVGIAGFKSYFGLWFHQGVFLNDPHRVLVNAQEGTTRGLRQWRFEKSSDIKGTWIKAYVKEAIENQKAGKEIKPAKRPLIIPEELKEALASDANLSEAFDSFTAGKQREFADYISSAKQMKTRITRLRKVVDMVKTGVGLNDKYR